jgi:recombinational DNA repair protein (RecF pathway)
MFEKVKNMIARLSPNGICDDCLANGVKLEKRADARAFSRQLLGTGGFERRKDQCCMCGSTKQVTRKVR